MALRTKRFISLKWKVFIITSIALAVIFSLLAVHNENTHKDQFLLHRQTAYSVMKQEAENKIESFSKQLHNLALSTLQYPGMKKALDKQSKKTLNKAFKNKWWPLQLKSGLDSIVFFSKENEIIGEWGGAHIRMHLVQQATRDKKDSWYVHCQTYCSLHAVVPLSVEDENYGAAIISASLNELLARFKNSTQVDVGIGVKATGNLLNPERYIENWGVNLIGLTLPKINIPLTNQAANQFSFEQLVKEARLFEHSNRQFEIRIWSLDKIASGSESYWVFISDLSEHVAELNQARLESLMYSIGGLFLAELLILLTLWEALARLKKLSALIPMLTSRPIKEIRNSLKENRRFSITNDESDQLNYVAILLSLKLEQLTQRVNRRNALLSNRSNQLKDSNEQLQQLIENAHVAIVSQTLDGTIESINGYGAILTGISRSQLIGQSFDKLFLKQSLDSQKQIQKFRKSPVDVLKQSLEFNRGSQSSPSYLLWMHTTIDTPTGRQILSVATDVTDQKEQENQLAWLAYHDPHTGLANRHRISEIWNALKSSSTHYKHFAGVVVLETFEQASPYQGLSERPAIVISELLKQLGKNANPIGRISSNRFVMFIREATEADIQSVAHKVINFIHSKPSGFQLTGRVGVGLYNPGSNQDTYEQVKASLFSVPLGKNDSIFQLDKDNDLVSPKELVTLSGLLDQFDTSLKYSPMVDLSSRQVSYYQADALIETPRKTWFQTELFHLGDTSEQLTQLSMEMVDVLIKDLYKLQNSNQPTLPIQLRTPLEALSQPIFLKHLKNRMEQYRIRPKLIQFDIPLENSQFRGEADAKTLAKLATAGFKLSLSGITVDNFDFRAFIHWPIHEIKLDAVYIEQQSKSGNEFLPTLRAMTQQRQLKLNAENILSDQQITIIESQMFNSFQGPVSADYEVLEYFYPDV